MIVAYTGLPLEVGGPRPLLDLTLGDMDEATVPCLVDSGAVHTLLPLWLARAAGIDPGPDGSRALGVAAITVAATFRTVPLRAAGHAWEAEVGFCDPWPFAWGLLGQRSFFRYFTVTFRAVDHELEVVPVVG